MKYEIEVYDHSPQYEDARNPSERLMAIEAECCLQDFLILCRRVRSIWPDSSPIELIASERQVGSRPINWTE